MKKCNKCGEHKPLDKFSPDKRNKDGRCGICRSCYQVGYFSDPERNKELTEQRRLKRKERKQEAIAYKGGKCNDCGGEFHPSVYEFHHLNPLDKDHEPGSLLRYSWKRLVAELDKCVLLCANCHRVRHWREDEDC